MRRPSQAAKVAAELCGDKTIVADVRDRIRKTMISTCLEFNRVKRGLTRKQVADKMGVSERKVSIMESSLDDNLKLGDIKKYLTALGFPKRCITVEFRKQKNQLVFINTLR